MLKYYYDCPIKAAYMATYHGMGFLSHLGEKLTYDGKFSTESCPHGEYGGEYFYIENPDVLSPQIGDLYYDNKGEIAYLLDKELCELWHKRFDGKIIMRNGIAFLPPEAE